MKTIGILSDSHGHIGDDALKHVMDCDEIWHAGDVGRLDTLEILPQHIPIKAVFGNIDGPDVRKLYPEKLLFECEGFTIAMLHIAGKPGKYAKGVKQWLLETQPDILVCGHSHIVQVVQDKELGITFMNPGAVGFEGFHLKRTLIKMGLDNKKISQLHVIELGNRSRR